MDIFESFCRTCGNECLDPLNIFDDNNVTAASQNEKVSLIEMLQACTPKSIPELDKDDDYPKQICRLCVKKLEMTYEFHMKWLSANTEFNVALKFEQRRKRSRKEAKAKLEEQEQKQEEQPPIIPPDVNVINDESEIIINETPPTPPSAAPCEMDDTELPSVEIPMPAIKHPELLKYACVDCDEKFYTKKACQFHRGFVHQ